MRRCVWKLLQAWLASWLLVGIAQAQSVTMEPQGPSDSLKPGLLRLSLEHAVDLALAPQGSTRLQLARELERQSVARAAQAQAALLPSIESSVGQRNQTVNLSAFGLRLDVPIPGFKPPERVGPFSVFDARATLRQNVLDLSSIRRFQAARAVVDATASDRDGTGDQVAGQVAKAYVSALRAQAHVDTLRSNVTLAEALKDLAASEKEAGTGTGIEVTRAQVQLFNERQRLLVAENESRQAIFQLLRAIGLDLDTRLELSDRLVAHPIPVLSEEQAIVVALQSRADFKAQQARMESARLNRRATLLERVPSIGVFADYGTIGSSLNHAAPTRSFGVTVTVPVFDGGRRNARRSESTSLLEQERIRIRDLRQQIELDVRVAFDRLRSAVEQVKVAEEGQGLAERELEQARRRYQAGVTTNLEVTDAQNRLQRARDNHLAALFNHNLSRIDLGEAMGTIRQLIP
ncbi:MAG: TolC family protein [Acidobacteria bacterium]|nr:TolC family protein [Acidobacteriota bacterium]